MFNQFLGAKFPLGQIVMTRAVADRIAVDLRFAEFVFSSLKRHANCDWGDMDETDKKANWKALFSGERLFSAYGITNKIWIITEADRSSTTILFPDD
jgi:hypothetical protein